MVEVVQILSQVESPVIPTPVEIEEFPMQFRAEDIVDGVEVDYPITVLGCGKVFDCKALYLEREVSEYAIRSVPELANCVSIEQWEGDAGEETRLIFFLDDIEVIERKEGESAVHSIYFYNVRVPSHLAHLLPEFPSHGQIGVWVDEEGKENTKVTSLMVGIKPAVVIHVRKNSVFSRLKKRGSNLFSKISSYST